jgi:hypothetical protein
LGNFARHLLLWQNTGKKPVKNFLMCKKTFSSIQRKSMCICLFFSMPEEDDSDSIKGKHWTPVPVNTHLLKQSKTLMHHSSMADLNQTEAEIKSRR